MPELPEVETIRMSLARQIVGRCITGVRVQQKQLRYPIDIDAIQKQAVGCKIEAVDRRAKYLLVRLHPEGVMVLHLGMTGRLRVGAPRLQDARHDHLIMQLGPDLELRFHDPRRFGMCFVTTAADLTHHPRLRHLGVEPLSAAFSATYLFDRARGRRKPVKNFLMDASVVVGIGNIYASESLFVAGICPTHPVGGLRLSHWKRICAAIQWVLQAAIENHGTTLSDYVDSDGQQGHFQHQLLVYGCEGQPCPRDGHPIRRIVQAGRSTYYCPQCQR